MPEAWGQKRQSPYGGKRAPYGVASGASNYIDRLSWAYAYECQDVSGMNWPPAGDGVTLTALSSGTTGINTGAWSNLPARMQNQGFRVGISSYGNDNFDFSSSDFHYRGLLDIEAGSANGNRIWRYIVSGVRLAEIRLISDTNIQFTVRNDASGGIFTGSFSGGGAPTGALFIDWWVSGASMGLYVNGVNYSPSDHTGAVSFHNGADTLTLLGDTVVPSLSVFHGWQFDRTITLAAHRIDAEEAGLYTPP